MKVKKKWIRMLALFATMLALPLNASAVRNHVPLDLDRPCSLKANVTGTETEAVAEKELSKLASSNIDIVLYKVASIEEVKGYDDYKYGAFGVYETQGTVLQDTANDLLRAEETEEGTAGSWDLLAQDIVRVVRDKGLSPTASGKADAAIDLGSDATGLYLMIVKQAGLQDYFKDVVLEDGSSRIVTRVLSEHYEYNFTPALVSIPEHREVTGGGYEWIYNVEVNPKHSTSYRYGSLEIVKELSSYEVGKPATFVFQVESRYADDPDRVGSEFVYSDVVVLNFTGAGSERITLENAFPIGATVYVEEVNSGSNYSTAAGTASIQNPVIQVNAATNDTVTITFNNDYNNSGNGGGVVVNSFEPNEDGTGWTWRQNGTVMSQSGPSASQEPANPENSEPPVVPEN